MTGKYVKSPTLRNSRNSPEGSFLRGGGMIDHERTVSLVAVAERLWTIGSLIEIFSIFSPGHLTDADDEVGERGTGGRPCNGVGAGRHARDRRPEHRARRGACPHAAPSGLRAHPLARLRGSLAAAALCLALLAGIAGEAAAQTTSTLSVSVSSTSGAEGNSGYTDIVVTVSLTQAVSSNTSLFLSFGGSAQRNRDYEVRRQTPDGRIASGTVSELIIAGQTQVQNLKLRVFTDTLWEQDETITVTIGGITLPDGVSLHSNPTATYTIENDDASDTEVSISGQSKIGPVREGGTAYFMVIAKPAPTSDMILHYNVSDEGGYLASAQQGNKTMTLRAGRSYHRLAVPTHDGDGPSADGRVRVRLLDDPDTTHPGYRRKPHHRGYADIPVVDDGDVGLVWYLQEGVAVEGRVGLDSSALLAFRGRDPIPPGRGFRFSIQVGNLVAGRDYTLTPLSRYRQDTTGRDPDRTDYVHGGSEVWVSNQHSRAVRHDLGAYLISFSADSDQTDDTYPVTVTLLGDFGHSGEVAVSGPASPTIKVLDAGRTVSATERVCWSFSVEETTVSERNGPAEWVIQLFKADASGNYVPDPLNRGRPTIPAHSPLPYDLVFHVEIDQEKSLVTPDVDYDHTDLYRVVLRASQISITARTKVNRNDGIEHHEPMVFRVVDPKPTRVPFCKNGWDTVTILLLDSDRWNPTDDAFEFTMPSSPANGAILATFPHTPLGNIGIFDDGRRLGFSHSNHGGIVVDGNQLKWSTDAGRKYWHYNGDSIAAGSRMRVSYRQYNYAPIAPVTARFGTAEASVTEGETARVPVTLDRPVQTKISLHFAVTGLAGTTIGTDTEQPPLSNDHVRVTFEPGQTTAYASLQTNLDDFPESNEGFGFSINKLRDFPSFVQWAGPNTLQVSLIDNNLGTLATASWETSEVVVNEGETARAPVVLDRPVQRQLRIPVVPTDQTAHEGSDFQNLDGELYAVFEPGQTRAFIEIDIWTDHKNDEGDETFGLTYNTNGKLPGIDWSGSPNLAVRIKDVHTLDPDGTKTPDDDSDDDLTPDPKEDIPTTLIIGVNDATDFTGTRTSVNENASDAALYFTIGLSTPVPPGGFVYVRYETKGKPYRNASAESGVDYIPVSGGVLFNPGEDTKQVRVQVLNDLVNEGNETMFLELSSPQGARFFSSSYDHRSGRGTIVNTDPIPDAWLARFGRTVAEQVLDGVSGRLAAPRNPGMEATLGGQALPSVAFGESANANAAHAGDGASSGAALAMADIARRFDAGTDGSRAFDPFDPHASRLRPETDSQSMTSRELLLGSSFSLTAAADGAGGTLAFWGRAAQSRFDGREGALSLDGDVTTGLIGADYARGRWLVGLALSQTDAEGGYADTGAAPRAAAQTCPAGEAGPLCAGAVRTGGGKVESTLTAATAYASVRASERLALWGAAGAGQGELRLAPENAGAIETDIGWTMAALGARGELLEPPPEGGPALALLSDALWARTTSDKATDLAATDSDVTRLRLGLEGSWQVQTGDGGAVVPKLTLGVRHDGGDAETGFGVEFGGGLAWSAPKLGLTADIEGRTLIAHEADGLKDRGYAASVAWDPDPATERGPSLTLRQDWGGQASGGLDALFAPDPLDRRTGQEATGRWSLEGAWGFPAFGDRFTGSPHVGLGLSAGARDYTVGWRLAPAAATAPDLGLGVKATRRESEGAKDEHTVGVEMSVRW